MKTVLEMAREAGFNPVNTDAELWEIIERFAALVREDEREACAKVCDERLMAHPIKDDVNDAYQFGVSRCAAAIRARGE